MMIRPCQHTTSFNDLSVRYCSCLVQAKSFITLLSANTYSFMFGMSACKGSAMCLCTSIFTESALRQWVNKGGVGARGQRVAG